ncbi:hypothetical protein CKF54_06970 [Psittacicella hinzii]|uniref:Uncharacterized protein n=1 Tax=Psittacicella hinzii TaxID=2028575 RepID=A0A3A1Y126_9GAMM|nr:hypothetical protein CKF54_06970 [Psittacicella hinzii]
MREATRKTAVKIAREIISQSIREKIIFSSENIVVLCYNIVRQIVQAYKFTIKNFDKLNNTTKSSADDFLFYLATASK